MTPIDFADKVITVTKTGATFTLHIEGYDDYSPDYIFCEFHDLKINCIIVEAGTEKWYAFPPADLWLRCYYDMIVG